MFSLNRTYNELQVITNNQDTIKPKYLYKSDFYSNVKCFSFKLRVVTGINNLVLYTRGVTTNLCTQKTESFKDTVSFKDVKL